ncbi:MAG: divalent heavy-metal cations transporter, partial [Actinomycetota bacterium]
SHILPEAHARHSSRWTLVSTIVGVLIMWGLVSQLEAVHVHGHESAIEHDHEHGDEHDHEHGDEEEDNG